MCIIRVMKKSGIKSGILYSVDKETPSLIKGMLSDKYLKTISFSLDSN